MMEEGINTFTTKQSMDQCNGRFLSACFVLIFKNLALCVKRNVDFSPLKVHIIFINIYFLCNVINSEELIGTTESNAMDELSHKPALL